MDSIACKLEKDSSWESDAESIRAAQYSLAGFKPLYARWLAPVFRFFYYRVGSVKDAEDLTSQVFLKVYEELPRYHDRGHFPAWLFTIVRHTVADYFRGKKPEVSLEMIDIAAERSDPLVQAVQTDEMQRLQLLVRSLPTNEQELLGMRFMAELNYREIGEILGRKEDAVRKTISRLLARLQNQLEVRHD
jgi:RNA polymerase sigma factor (sigma-70 family)